MIRNILFDMGNVLIRWEPKTYIQLYGIQDKEDAELLYREVFQSVEWARLDRGTLDEPEAEEIILPRLPERLQEVGRKLISHWNEFRLVVPGMEELVAELSQKGYGLYLLTNASHRQKEYWPTFPVSQHFGDRVFRSADYLLLKPDARYFETALKRFGLKAEECLFTDDFPYNVEAAQNCGIHAVVFHGSAELFRNDLRKFGVNI